MRFFKSFPRKQASFLVPIPQLRNSGIDEHRGLVLALQLNWRFCKFCSKLYVFFALEQKCPMEAGWALHLGLLYDNGMRPACLSAATPTSLFVYERAPALTRMYRGHPVVVGSGGPTSIALRAILSDSLINSIVRVGSTSWAAARELI